MKLAGVTLNQFLKIGVCAVVFIIVFKLAAKKSGVGGLQTLASQV